MLVAMPPDGPVEPGIQSANYPAGPGWWLGPDDLWRPPPAPPEPPGTVHHAGERRRTWQGTEEFDGRAWVLLDEAVAYSHPATVPSPTSIRWRRQAAISRLVAYLIIGDAVLLSALRFFPAVDGTAACNGGALQSTASVLACGPDLSATYHYSYSWWNLSNNYDPWISPSSNGREVLFLIAALASVLWAWVALRQRTTKRKLIVSACLLSALVAASDVVSFVQLSRFDTQWVGQAYCAYLTCSVSLQDWGVGATAVLSLGLPCLCAALLLVTEKDHPIVKRRGPVY